MKIRIVTPAVFLAVLVTFGLTIRAEDTSATASIEQRLSILEQKYESDKKDASAKESTVIVGSKDGFQIKSADGSFNLKFSAVFQTDYRDFRGDHPTNLADQFLLRRVRPTLEGTVNKYVAFRITPDFANGGGTTSGPSSSLLPDAWIELQYFSAAKLRFGKIKPPFGIENIQADSQMFFIERSIATQIGPVRDTGAQIGGDFRGGQFSYQVAVLNGVADGTSGETDSNDGKDYAARVFTQPFKATHSEWLNGLGIGLAGSIGDQLGTTSTTGLTSGYRTDGQQTFFTYAANTFANGQRKRLSPQGYWYTSHAGLIAEYAASSQEIKRVSTSTTTATITNRAWQVAGSIVLTGERPSFNGVKPRKIFDPKNHSWGALELIGRYAVLRVEDDAFTQGFAATASSAKKAKVWSTGLNWYLNNNVRISSNYAVTSFVGGATSGNRPTEKVILSRVQLTY